MDTYYSQLSEVILSTKMMASQLSGKPLPLCVLYENRRKKRDRRDGEVVMHLMDKKQWEEATLQTLLVVMVSWCATDDVKGQ